MLPLRVMRGALIFSLMGMIFLVPTVAFGSHEGGIVPCHTGEGCDWAAIVQLGQNLLNFLITLAITVSAIVFAYAGFLYFTAGGDSGKVTKAHGLFASVVIGLIIVLTAWLIVNTLLDTLTGKGLDQRASDSGLSP